MPKAVDTKVKDIAKLMNILNKMVLELACECNIELNTDYGNCKKRKIVDNYNLINDKWNTYQQQLRLEQEEESDGE